MSDPASIQLKLDRAREHLDAFETERLAWVSAHLPRLERRWVNEYTEGFTIRGVDDPPQRLGVLVGDFAHNLRSALDHAVFALWLAHSGLPQASQIRGVKFPIELDRDGFDAIRDRSLGGLADSAAEAVESLQPYHQPRMTLPAWPGNEPPSWHARRHPLWLLKQISNVDKHRLLPLTVVQSVGHIFDPPIPLGLGQVVWSSTGPLAEGQEVLQFAYSQPHPAEPLNPRLVWDVGFGEQADVGVDRRPLYPVRLHLRDMLRFVCDEALPALAPHF